MAQEIFHRGYRIIAESYKSDTGKWIPKARIIPVDEAMAMEERPLNWPQEFETKLQADSFALDGAQLYIDSHY